MGKIFAGKKSPPAVDLAKNKLSEDCCWDTDYFSRRELSIKKEANYSKYDNEHITVKKYYRAHKSFKNNA
ncbi:hypothetical protein [Yersinia frederiksenii]|uniref:hypothetical protein n=1 Tax=Yersinia frederiksenii TaxID=29484 RepID=UPI00051970EC|nr:hypothetical protein [Yersinia frederiksenii]ATM96711.1 hypothetical protein CRN75_15910 [Yersinia frederiksenii]